MLYLAIPAQNEVATIGVLLWRLRTVLAEFPREYEVVVYDDASTDDTAAVAEQYVHAMPVTVLRGKKAVGYAGAVNALVRHVSAHTRYPRRDAMLLLQADFTDPPGIVPEFARRFEGGADLVVGERTAVVDAPKPVGRLFKAAGWAMRPFVRVEGVRDMTGSMRLIRISALRDLLKTVGDEAVCEGNSWTANADLLLRLVPHARRIETVPLEPTYGVRTRDTRRVTMPDALAALRWAWGARGRRVSPSLVSEAVDVPAKGGRGAPQGTRRDEPDVTADKLRERSRERDRLRGGVSADQSRDARPERERSRGARSEGKRNTTERARTRDETIPAPTVAPTTDRIDSARPAKRPRSERSERVDRQMGRGKAPGGVDDTALILDDPFAAPTTRRTAALSTASDDATASIASDAMASVPTADQTSSAEAPEAMSDAPGSAFQPEDRADQEPGERERKRRRNRRSRRRKSKAGGDAQGDGTDSEPEGHTHDTDRASAGDDARDDSAYDSGADDSLDARDDTRDDAGHESAADGEAPGARSRRRGRRGRRGGARRARGRGRDEGDTPGPGGGGDSGDSSGGSDVVTNS